MLFIKNLKFIILFVVVFSSKVFAECGDTCKNTKDFLNKKIKVIYDLYMKITFKIYVFLFSLFTITNLLLKPIYAIENEKSVKEALGFMIGGDGG